MQDVLLTDNDAYRICLFESSPIEVVVTAVFLRMSKFADLVGRGVMRPTCKHDTACLLTRILVVHTRDVTATGNQLRFSNHVAADSGPVGRRKVGLLVEACKGCNRTLDWCVPTYVSC